MEEENAKSETFDTSSINNVKVGLMGPMSGIGDSFFWGTFRVIAAGIGIGLAKSGNILGAVIYFLLYTAIHFITKILGGKSQNDRTGRLLSRGIYDRHGKLYVVTEIIYVTFFMINKATNYF